MPYRSDSPQWDIPFGFAGIGAMALVGGIAFTLGEFTIYGIQFLAYWHLIAGAAAPLAVFAAASGTLVECLVWNGRLGGRANVLPSWEPNHKAMLAAGIFVLLAVVYGVAHRQSQCLLFIAPPLFLIVFAIAAALQQPILRALRDTGRAGVALAALLVFEAAIMFAIGQWMAIGHYSKGLKHFQDEKRSSWSIATTASADFYIDYERREVVLQGRSGGSAFDIRSPLADFACK